MKERRANLISSIIYLMVHGEWRDNFDSFCESRRKIADALDELGQQQLENLHTALTLTPAEDED